MGHRAWGDEGDWKAGEQGAGSRGEEFFPSAPFPLPLPIPYAPCPMPNEQSIGK